MYAVFIDFTKTFDTVSTKGLWLVLKRFGCTEKDINLIKALHIEMQVKVVQESEASDQSLFSLYLTAMPDVAFRNVKEGIYIQTRSGADLFNLLHFKLKTCTLKHLVREIFLLGTVCW